MNKDYKSIKQEIIYDLHKSNETLKTLESKIVSNSLLKFHLVEKTTYSGLFFKKKKISKNKQTFPNQLLIAWVECMISQLHQDYTKILGKSKQLQEFGVQEYTQISNLINSCDSIYSQIKAFLQQDLSYFSNKINTCDTITLYRAEKYIQDSICDLRIEKEIILEKLSKEIAPIPQQVHANV